MKGTVKWFSDEKGYGFIAAEDGGPDCFVYHRDIVMTGRRTLADGQVVEFTPTTTDRGRRATEVVPE